jgi:hypothetical protein
MTSHYPRCTPNGSFETVFQALGAEFGDIYSRKFWKAGESLTGVILGEPNYFRVKNDAALLITLKEVTSTETRLEIIACTVGSGLLGISYGSHDSFVQWKISLPNHASQYRLNSGPVISTETPRLIEGP